MMAEGSGLLRRCIPPHSASRWTWPDFALTDRRAPSGQGGTRHPLPPPVPPPPHGQHINRRCTPRGAGCKPTNATQLNGCNLTPSSQCDGCRQFLPPKPYTSLQGFCRASKKRSYKWVTLACAECWRRRAEHGRCALGVAAGRPVWCLQGGRIVRCQLTGWVWRSCPAAGT
jgi:hypothetical protein